MLYYVRVLCTFDLALILTPYPKIDSRNGFFISGNPFEEVFHNLLCHQCKKLKMIEIQDGPGQGAIFILTGPHGLLE